MLSKAKQIALRKRNADAAKRRSILFAMAKYIPLDELSNHELVQKDQLLPLKMLKKHRVDQAPLYSCPNCAEVVVRCGDNFCPCCGRKLKWWK